MTTTSRGRTSRRSRRRCLRPTRSASGSIWTTFLALITIALVFLFRTQIAQFLLQDPGQADAVVFATITGCVWAIMKLAEMVIWFEGRGLTYALSSRAADLQPDRDHPHRLGGRRA